MSKTKVIAISLMKGGVAKTTSVLNIGACLARKKKRILLIDLDPQYNLSLSLGIEDAENNIYTIMKGESEVEPLEIGSHLHLIPSNLNLTRGEVEFNAEFEREKLLKKILEPLKKDYDYIIIDCPPSLGILTINAVIASDFIISPIDSNYLALKGYSILKESLEKIGRDIDKVFITRQDKRKIIHRQVEQSLREMLGNKVLQTTIRETVALSESPTRGLSILDYDSDSRGAKDYLKLTNELIKKLKF